MYHKCNVWHEFWLNFPFLVNYSFKWASSIWNQTTAANHLQRRQNQNHLLVRFFITWIKPTCLWWPVCQHISLNTFPSLWWFSASMHLVSQNNYFRLQQQPEAFQWGRRSHPDWLFDADRTPVAQIKSVSGRKIYFTDTYWLVWTIYAKQNM